MSFLGWVPQFLRAQGKDSNPARGRNGIFATVAVAGSGFLWLSYRKALDEQRNRQPGNLHVRTERSGESHLPFYF